MILSGSTSKIGCDFSGKWIACAGKIKISISDFGEWPLKFKYGQCGKERKASIANNAPEMALFCELRQKMNIRPCGKQKALRMKVNSPSVAYSS